MLRLQMALDLAERGYFIFPINANSKLPAIKDFTGRATRGVEKIHEWFGDTDYNIGIITSKFGDVGEALVVVDVDTSKNKKGDETLLALEFDGFELPKTVTQTTPTGGKHYIFKHSEAVKQGANVLGKGVDIRSRGGYIVGAGSTIGGKNYLMSFGAPADCPQWVIDICGTETEIVYDKPDTYIENDATVERAKTYLLKDAKPAVEGDAGDQTTYQVATRLKDLGITKTTALDLMLEIYNDRCEPPWEPLDLQRKIENAYEYGQNPAGIAAPENEFDEIDDNTKSYLEKINDEFALVGIGDRYGVIQEFKVKGRVAHKFLNEITFKRMLSYRKVDTGKNKIKSEAEVWLDWPRRREYWRGVGFYPEAEAPEGVYNTWHGFAVKPLSFQDANKHARAGFNAFMDHALKNVCLGNEEHFDWLMGYFAHMIQKPYEKPLVTLVFQGSKGVGKNALIERIRYMIGGEHCAVAHDSRYLTSNFNGHLEGKLCLILDEAFWSGDKSAEGKLKGLTTSPTLFIERKGYEAYETNNYLRIVIIGNEDWLVAASADERRYAVFEVGEGRKQDTKFFHNMRINMDNNGGAGVLLDYLKKFDLSKVDINVAPNTEALSHQKVESLPPFEQFWYDCLNEGAIVGVDFIDSWPEKIEKDLFTGAYERYAKKRSIRSWVPSKAEVTRKLSRLVPNEALNCRINESGHRKRAYALGSLEACRTRWDKIMSTVTKWD